MARVMATGPDPFNPLPTLEPSSALDFVDSLSQSNSNFYASFEARDGQVHQGTEDQPTNLDELESLKEMRARSLEPKSLRAVVARVGLIESFEGQDEKVELEPAFQSVDHQTVEVVKDRLENQESYDILKKFEMPKFRPAPGDVIIAAKPTCPGLKPGDVEAADTMIGDAEPLDIYPANERSRLNGLVSLYQDPFYFIDDREYRKEVSDVYEIQLGDIVARLGHFNENWHWTDASTFNFFLYYPRQLEGDCCKNSDILGPWLLLNNPEISQTQGFEPDLPQKPASSVNPVDQFPFSNLSQPFEFKEGDILIHHTNDKTLFKPWNVGVEITIENSHNRGLLQKIARPLDTVLRYEIHVEHSVDDPTESTTIYVELFQFCGNWEWKFLGKYEGLYNHAKTLPPMIRFNENTPQPGDIFINGHSCREWDEKEKIGGLIEIYKDEHFFELLKKSREEVENHHYGIGEETAVVRFGSFASKEWNWMPKTSVDIFLLTRRGTKLRRHHRIPWQDQWRPHANYILTLRSNVQLSDKMPAEFKPSTGDVIIHYCHNPFPSTDDVHKWEKGDLCDFQKFPGARIEFFNSTHLVKNRIKHGDWLLRAGYELSDKDKRWTNVTAELYRYVVDPGNLTHVYWTFEGRDTHVFGTMPWPERHGLFQGRQRDTSSKVSNEEPETTTLDAERVEDYSRLRRLFLSSLGYLIVDDSLIHAGSLLL